MASEKSESDPVEEAPSPAADVPQEKPARASNDPREVRRREREAALRSQGVKVPDTDNESQDKLTALFELNRKRLGNTGSHIVGKLQDVRSLSVVIVNKNKRLASNVLVFRACPSNHNDQSTALPITSHPPRYCKRISLTPRSLLPVIDQ